MRTRPTLAEDDDHRRLVDATSGRISAVSVATKTDKDSIMQSRLLSLAVMVQLATLALSLAARAQNAPAGDGQRPNIVFVLMDNLGYGEIGSYGSGMLRGAPTPRIDKLATESMRLLNFNVEAQCTP